MKTSRTLFVFLLTFVAIDVSTIKKPNFITPDGISSTLKTVEVYLTESNTYITSSLWNLKKTCTFQCRYLLLLALLMAGDVETQPGPTMKFMKKLDSDSKISVDGYFIERLDQKKGTYGGVVSYVCDDVNYERCKDFETDDIEAIWLEINLPKSSPLLIQ